MLAVKIRAAEILKRLPNLPVVGAEIGIWRGHMSALLLKNPNINLYMVDNWKEVDAYVNEGYGADAQIENMALAVAQTEFASSRRGILRMDSDKAAEEFNDGSLDFVFIDADHSYEGVRDDIISWLPKVKPGGLLGGHDYANPRYAIGAEVKRAVDEAVASHGWELDLGDNVTWFVRV